jgi:hypothetical protein
MSHERDTALEAARILSKEGMPELTTLTELLDSTAIAAAAAAWAVIGRRPHLLSVKLTAIDDDAAPREAWRATVTTTQVLDDQDPREVRIGVELRGADDCWLGEATFSWI